MNNPLEDALAYLRRKAWAAGLAFFVLLLALGYRLWYLQVKQGAYYYAQAQNEALAPITLPAARGEILDRKGFVLAADVPSFAAMLSYTPRPPSQAEVALLSRILNMPAEEIVAAAQALRSGTTPQPYAPVILRTGLSAAQYTAIEENLTNLPGVDVQAQPVRSYPGIPGDVDPGPDLGANIIGYVQKGVVSGDVVGADGVEKSFNTLNPDLHLNALGLAGQDGQELVQVDRASHPDRQVAVQPPVPGNNVVLTIDAGLQAVAQNAIAAQLMALRTRNFGSDGGPFPGAYWGAAAAIDVHTGAVLALASVPTIDPNAFAQNAVALPGSAANQAFSQEYNGWLNDSLGTPFTDHAISSPAPPGSTFKPITAIAAMQAGLLTPWEHIPCPPSIPLGNGEFLNNWIHVYDGNLDLTEALARSCDTYFYAVGNAVGINAIDRVASAFGLGQLTGQQDLYGETAGTLSSPQAYENIYHLPWNSALTMQTAIGQGLNEFTVLQMADYAAALANGGTLYQPYLVGAVTSAKDGKVLWQQQPVVRNRIPLTSEIVQAIHQAMSAVTQCDTSWIADGVSDDCGTAYWSFYNFSQETQKYLGQSIQVAGKTGTAETTTTVTPDGWWVSWAPADNPQIAIVVHTEKSGEGFVGGAPIAREMYDYWFGLDTAMWKAGATDQIIPPAIQQYFGLTQHYPDWWGAPPQPASAAAAAVAQSPAAVAAGGAGAAQNSQAAAAAPGSASAAATPVAVAVPPTLP